MLVLKRLECSLKVKKIVVMIECIFHLTRVSTKCGHHISRIQVPLAFINKMLLKHSQYLFTYALPMVTFKLKWLNLAATEVFMAHGTQITYFPSTAV